MVTNGEHNGLRMRGNTRPLHILQVRAEARAKVSGTSVKNLVAMLSPAGLFYLCALEVILHYNVKIVKEDGSVTAILPNEAISGATLQMILDLRRSGLNMDDIIERLRSQTVPSVYPIHPWVPSMRIYVF